MILHKALGSEHR